MDWKPIESAPKDGTVIKVLSGGLEDTARWTQDRVCAGGHVPNGHFGEGWEQPDIGLALFAEFEPSHWKPLSPLEILGRELSKRHFGWETDRLKDAALDNVIYAAEIAVAIIAKGQ